MTDSRFGAVADGADTGSAFTGTDNTAAFQAAVDYASSLGLPIFVPPGKYRFADLGATNITLNGDYYLFLADGAEFLLDDLGPGNVGSALFGSAVTTNRRAKSFLGIVGATFRGRWSQFNLTSWDGNGGRRGLVVYGFAEVILDRVRAYDIRSQFCNSFSCDSAKILGCTFERIARAAIRFNDTDDVLISNNRFKWVDDDAIACTGSISGAAVTPNTIRRRVNIINNTFFQCETVLLQEGRVTNVIGNQFILSKAVAIRVGDNAPRTTPFAINVIGNTLENTTPRYDSLGDTGILDAENGTAAITVVGSLRDESTTDAPPGYSDGTVLVDPRGKDNNGTWLIETQNASRASGFGYVVANNDIHQTQLPVGNYSDWGYGEMFTYRGWKDPVLGVTKIARHGITVVHDVEGVIIQGNNVSGHRVGAGIFLEFANSFDQSRTFRKILVTGNVCWDNRRGISTSREGTGSTVPVSVRSFNNIWDCDPYMVNARRTAASIAGTWQAGTGVDDMVAGIDMRGTTGWTIRNDIFANCIEAVSATGGIDDTAEIQGCVVLCDPAAVGFSTSNKGVGNVPAGGESFTHEIRHCDATDAANFDLLKNTCMNSADSIPTAGTFVRGHFVSNNAPTIAGGEVLRGWLRLTTGAGHVSGTDWAPTYSLVT